MRLDCAPLPSRSPCPAPGYSWKSQQYGLTSDTLLGFDIVLPNGVINSVTPESDADLFWAVLGGGNRFGVAYTWHLPLFPQTDVWGGFRLYAADVFDEVASATRSFIESNKEPKATVLPVLSYNLGLPLTYVVAFYDGPDPPEGTFAAFDRINGSLITIDTWSRRSFKDLVASVPDQLQRGQRGGFNGIALTGYSAAMVDLIVAETRRLGLTTLAHSGTFLSANIEPIDSSIGELARSSAWDHSAGRSPFNLFFGWRSPADDSYWHQALVDFVAKLAAQAEAEGATLGGDYPNYAVSEKALGLMYRDEDLARLKRLRKVYDAEDVMGLTTWFDV